MQEPRAGGGHEATTHMSKDEITAGAKTNVICTR